MKDTQVGQLRKRAFSGTYKFELSIKKSLTLPLMKGLPAHAANLPPKVNLTKHLRPPTDHAHAVLNGRSPSIARETGTKVTGLLGSVSFNGASVTINKNGFGPTMQGQNTIALDQIRDIIVKPGTRLHHGFIQFVVQGRKISALVKHGPISGRPHMTDPDSMSFTRKTNDAIEILVQQIRQALATTGHPVEH